jgi:hypothetical protein
MPTADIVAAAREAAAAGRALHAVDLLAAVPRSERTVELSAEMVLLRNRAFSELDRRPGRPSWPVAFADAFPGERGIPEVGRRGLTGAVLGAAIVHHGCLRVNGLFEPRQVERFRELIAHAHDERERGDGDFEWFVPFEPGREKAEGFGRQAFVRVVDVPVALGELVDAFADVGVTGAVTDYFNERPAMIANKWGLRRTMPVTETRCADFHQDGAFLGDDIRTVDAWIALSRCGPGTGAPSMDLVPRRLEVLPAGEGAFFPWSLAESVAREAAGDAGVASPVFAPGDALFFDERLVHRTAVGPDTEARYAIESWFVAPSSYPAKHLPVVL